MTNNITQIAKDTLISALKEPTRIELKRKYLQGVTIGVLTGFINGEKVVETKTIELKWKNNIKRESCIPENIYPIEPTIWHKHNKKVLGIFNVENRSEILMHPANYASGKHVELLGCIAPVTSYKDLDGDGIIDGVSSKIAFDKIMAKFGNLKTKIIIYS